MKYLLIFFIFLVSTAQIKSQYLKNLTGQPLSDEVLQIVLYDTKGEKTSMGDVLEKLKGNIIYMDIWASWCKACIVESEYTKEIQKDYKDKKIAFLFLSSDTDYKQWLKGLSVINLEGSHYRIDPENKKTIQSFFKIRGIPYYVLLTNQGNIFDAKAPWPHLPKMRSELDMILSISK
jgi:thiol-disulfide isomerase/thioredoxin